ncbi:hypothetical protein [uncultured Sphingomonas sp.]|uniref:hypothetical protein n=1 Tax=uncultured Sphingomonas sp. TaxID=158754 RepID=UPI0035CAA0AE
MDPRQGEGLERTRATPAMPPVDAAVAIGLEPLRDARRRWPAWAGAALTLLMIAGLARELLGDGLDGLTRSVPGSPLFYGFFALAYLALPVTDYLIFRRLWRIPAAGLAATLKKRVANEILFSYSGEAYFYSWARANAPMVAAPFGAVKDVSILSAMAGNAVTLALMALSIPLGAALLPAGMEATAGWSAAVLVATSLPFLLFRGRVFSLDRPALWWIFGAHCGRLVAGSLLLALAWEAALPGASMAMWLFLAAGRLLVSRLPFVPNKDLLFANLAIMVLGGNGPLSELMAFTAALTLVVDAGLLAAFGVAAIARRRTAR